MMEVVFLLMILSRTWNISSDCDEDRFLGQEIVLNDHSRTIDVQNRRNTVDLYDMMESMQALFDNLEAVTLVDQHFITSGFGFVDVQFLVMES